MSRPDQRDRQGWDGAGAPGGASSRPEPGAGSAGPGAAQRRRLIEKYLLIIRQRVTQAGCSSSVDVVAVGDVYAVTTRALSSIR